MAKGICLTSLHDRPHDLVDVVGAVELVRILASDQVTVQYYKLLVFCVQDFIQDLDGIDILLGTPLIPRV